MKIDFSSLSKCLTKIDARKRTVEMRHTSALEVIQTVELSSFKGKEITSQDIEFIHNKLLSHKGKQITVHIQNHAWNFPEVIENPSKGRKVHFFWCRTLQKMEQDGRFPRYVAKDEKYKEFYITGIIDDQQVEGYVELDVCKNCLNESNYKGYGDYKQYNNKTEMDKIFNTFDFEEMFDTYKQHFPIKPKYKERQRNDAGYPPNWRKISQKFRKLRGWKCENCGLFLGEPRYNYLLHAHHKNGDTQNNNYNNLQALCYECHCDKHPHMYRKQSTILTIRHLRNAQQILPHELRLS